MSKQYFNMGVGWKKTLKNGDEYYSCKANTEANDKGNVRLQAVNQHGETVDIENFVIFYNKKEKDTHPDVRLVFSLEE